MNVVAHVRRAAAVFYDRRRLAFHGVFWSWNVIFLSVVLVGLLPHVLWALICGVLDGDVPISMAAGAAILTLVPLCSTAVGAGYFRHQPDRLIRLFYGIEAPFFLVSMMRIFVLREITPGMGLLLTCISICLVSYGLTLATPGRLLRGGWGALQLGGQSLALICCVHAGLLATFYAVPLGGVLVKEFFRMRWLMGMADAIRYSHGTALIWAPLVLVLMVFSATLFVLMPPVLVALYGGAWRNTARAFSARHHRGWAAAILVLAGVVYGGLHALVNRQPQARAFALVENPPKDDAGRQALLTRSAEVRAGLLNAHLAPYRYLSARGSDDHLIDIYYDVFGLPRTAGRHLQDAFNVLARPALYDGPTLHGDMARADAAYESFFDAPLQKAERGAIRHALSSTYERERREAGLLAADERKVRLLRQELTVHELGDVAEVDLHEVYENQTTSQQEIFYFITLPESAAVTGIWLGDGDKETDRFPFVVSPRGAAQKVYKREVHRRVDPALLEQLGPRQYRLRAFPIPPRTSARVVERGELPKAPRFHLWLRYRTLPGVGAAEDTWPMPVLRERRNIYWDSGTERVYPARAQAAAGDWLPATVPTSGRLTRRAHALVVPAELGTVAADQELVLLATPRPETPPDLRFLQGQRLAVVLDRSYSMRQQAAAVNESFAWLRREVGEAAVDVYLSAAQARGEAPTQVALAGFRPESVVYYGGGKASELLQQFATLRGERAYHAILVLTDDGSLDLADDKAPARDLGAKVVLVHLGGRLPPGYDDATLETVARRGGAVVTRVEQAMRYLQAAAEGPNFVGVDAGYRFTLERRPLGATPADPAFAALGARQVIKGAMLDLAPGSPERLAQLDRLHQLARAHTVVTPYSSMIVLVDERQREALRQAEAAKDRFQRDTESGKDALVPPSDLMSVTATPEPEEWLLIGLVGAALLFAARRRRAEDLASA